MNEQNCPQCGTEMVDGKCPNCESEEVEVGDSMEE